MGTSRALRCAGLAAALASLCGVEGGLPSSKDYCVIGAGPAGLQLGYCLQADKRDYVVLEKNAAAGSFFSKFPRHRKFISTNKRFTGKNNAEFNMRHDWNSLLSDPPFTFTNYSDLYFPPADDYVTYLGDYARFHSLQVSYNTAVEHIEPKGAGQGFAVDTTAGLISCRYVVVATGLEVPHLPDIGGMEHVTGYEDMSIDPKDYTNKTVLILGKGQSAFETAQHIYGETARIDLFSRSRPRLALQTHYVGDVRAINMQFFDAYQLKSMDTIQESDFKKFGPFFKNEEGKIALSKPFGDQELFRYDDDGPLLDADGSRPFDWWDVVIRATGWEFNRTMFGPAARPKMNSGPTSYKYPSMLPDFRSVNVPDMWFAGTLSHGLDWRKSSGGFIHGFRYNARALARVLGHSNHADAWPHSPITYHLPTEHPGSHYKLATDILRRCTEMSGPYQMFGKLVDLYVFTAAGRALRFEEVPIGFIPDVVDSLPGHGITVKTYVTVMFQYGKGYGGAGVDTLSAGRVVRPHAVDNEETGPGHLQNFIHPVFRNDCYDDASCGLAETLPFHIGEDIHTSYIRPVFDVEPLSRYLRRIGSLPGDTPTAAAAQRGGTAPSGHSRSASRSALPPSSDLPPVPTPAGVASGCGAGQVEVYTDTCAVAEIHNIEVPAEGAKADQGLFHYRNAVPLLSRHASQPVQDVLPWLKDYVLSREGEWRELQRASDTKSDDSTLMARRERFNVLNSGRTKSERQRLGLVAEFVSQSLLSFMEHWQGTAGSAENKAFMKSWQPYVKGFSWGKIPGVVSECWPTVDRAGPNTKWEEYSFEQPYDHPYPFQAELHLDAAPSHTAFRSPFGGQQVFVLPSANGRLDVYPGGVRHSSDHWAEATPRVSLRFNFDIRNRVECQIPLVMDWCTKQGATHLATLVDKDKVAELDSEASFQVLDVDHKAVAKLYRPQGGSAADGAVPSAVL